MIERETIKVVKLQDQKGNIIELLSGKWKCHIAVNLYEDDAGNLIEVVEEKK